MAKLLEISCHRRGRISSGLPFSTFQKMVKIIIHGNRERTKQDFATIQFNSLAFRMAQIS